MADEPELRAGDSGEWVTHLQQRLYDLSLYEGAVDGNYGETTEAAVKQLHEDAGIQHDGGVTWQTWQSVAEKEQWAGITTYSQQDSQQDAGAAEAGAAEVAAGRLSEDGQWQWDGNDWQAVGTQESATQEPAAQSSEVLSEDGLWRWDGSQWQAVTQQQPVNQEQPSAETEQHEVWVNDDIDDWTTEEAVAPS